MDLISLLNKPEGKTLEFKRDLSSPEGALKTLVAFANTSGGILLVGVEDGTKRVKGVADILTAEERLANLIADSISPKLVPSMEVFPWQKNTGTGSRDLSQLQSSTLSKSVGAGGRCFCSRGFDESAS